MGCQTFQNPDPYVHSRFEYAGKEVTLIIQPALKTNGITHWWSDKAIIVLRHYPICLKHELKHVKEGHWHDLNKPNGEYCH